MDETRKTEFEPGRAPVWADQMAAHGAPPPPPPPVDRAAYASPGPPPWDSGRKKTAPWAIMVTVLGSIALCVAGCLGLALVGGGDPAETDPSPTSPAPAAVTTSGKCEKKMVGEYGLVATVGATNTTENSLSGTIWVRWPVTGEAAQEFTKRVTLAPGQRAELLVNEGVTGERWLRMGECSYGWTYGVRKAPVAAVRTPDVVKTPAVRRTAPTVAKETRKDTGKSSGGSRRSWFR